MTLKSPATDEVAGDTLQNQAWCLMIPAITTNQTTVRVCKKVCPQWAKHFYREIFDSISSQLPRKETTTCLFASQNNSHDIKTSWRVSMMSLAWQTKLANSRFNLLTVKWSIDLLSIWMCYGGKLQSNKLGRKVPGQILVVSLILLWFGASCSPFREQLPSYLTNGDDAIASLTTLQGPHKEHILYCVQRTLYPLFMIGGYSEIPWYYLSGWMERK